MILNSDVKDADSGQRFDPDQTGKQKRSPPLRVLLTKEYIDALPRFSPKPKEYIDTHPEVTSIQRVYDTLLPQLLLRNGQRDKPKFYVFYTDPVTKKAENEYVAQWGDKVEVTNKRGNTNLADITIEQVRIKAHAALARIQAITNEYKSPILERKIRIKADAMALMKGKTLREAWNEYLSFRTKLTKPSRDSLRRTFEHLADVLDKPMTEWCTPAWLETRLLKIQSGKSDYKRGGSGRTAELVAEYLRQIINVVDADETLLGKNPAAIALARLKRGPQHVKVKRKKSIIPAADLFDLFMALKRLEENQDYQAHDFISLLLYTGLRENAASLLSWQDMRLESGFMYVYFDTNLERQVIVPLSDRAIEILRARYERLQQHQEWPDIKEAGWVFPSKYTPSKRIDSEEAETNNPQSSWSYIKETKRFFDRLAMATNIRLVKKDEWQRPVKDSEGRLQYITHPDNPDIYIYKHATAHDFRRMTASYAKNFVGESIENIEKLLTHKSETLTEGYIVDENDIAIKQVRASFNRLAEFIDSGREASFERLEKFNARRLTKAALSNPSVPVVRSKHAAKTKPTFRTTSHP